LRNLQGYQTAALERAAERELTRLRQGRDRCVLLSSLARGADQLCARIGLALGYALVCPLPFADYRRDFTGDDLIQYNTLLRQAGKAVVVSEGTQTDAAYLAAGRYVVDHCDVLLAVWDGAAQQSICGTQAVIAYARQRQTPVIILTPDD